MAQITEDSGRGPAGWSVPPWVRSAARAQVSALITLLGLLALTFFIGRLLPLDPVLAVLGDDAGQEAYDRMYRQLGLDRPVWEQFVTYVVNMATLDLGRSITTGNMVVEDLARVFPATIELASVAILVGVIVGVPAGVAAAVYRGRLVDHVVRVVGLIGYSAPNFWLGLMGLVVFYAALGWVDGPGRIDTFYMWDIETVTGMYLIDTAIAGQWEIWRNAVGHLVLPASILGYGAMAYIARMTRSFMLEQLNQEYVIAARAKGLSKARVVWLHAFRNIQVQLITVIALAYAFLLEGAVLTETVFAWPGFGRYLTHGLLRGDMSIVVPCTLIVGLIFLALNLFSDILYRILDPRTR